MWTFLSFVSIILCLNLEVCINILYFSTNKKYFFVSKIIFDRIIKKYVHSIDFEQIFLKLLNSIIKFYFNIYVFLYKMKN